MAADHADATAGNSGSSSGVAIVGMGAALVLVSWVLFEVIATEYFVTTVALVIAAALVLIPRLAPQAMAAIAPVGAFNKVGGYALAFAGVVELIDDLRFDAFDGFVSVLGALVAYAGYVLAFVGARTIAD